MEKMCEREAVTFHSFLRDWLAGAVPRTTEAFERFSGVMGDGLEVISPLGTVTAREPLIEEFEGLHGVLAAQADAFQIWVENYRCRRVIGDYAVATYEEWHRLKDDVSARLSTALYRKRADTPNGVEWLHVHETWLPGKAPRGGERFPEPADG